MTKNDHSTPLRPADALTVAKSLLNETLRREIDLLISRSFFQLVPRYRERLLLRFDIRDKRRRLRTLRLEERALAVQRRRRERRAYLRLPAEERPTVMKRWLPIGEPRTPSQDPHKRTVAEWKALMEQGDQLAYEVIEAGYDRDYAHVVIRHLDTQLQIRYWRRWLGYHRVLLAQKVAASEGVNSKNKFR